MTRTSPKVQPRRAEAAPVTPLSVAPDLLAWYDRHRRDLPWRARPGESSDPYAVWLSEIMLQQTTVAAVRAYYTRFLARWPNVAALATAPLEAVLQAWAGLGYYSRARNLHACAQAVVEKHGGHFPDSEEMLRTLPGVGAYTAAAIAAIAFGRRAVVVDGNVERVMARLGAIEAPMPAGRPAVWAAMDAATPARRAGDFAQAVMDLGATICTPKSPACIVCPITRSCTALQRGEPAAFPRKIARKATPHRHGAVFIVERPDNTILVRSRPAQGLFGGMTEFPGTAWTEDFDPAQFALPPGLCGPLTVLGRVDHGLTHFDLTLHVFQAQPDAECSAPGRWVPRAALKDEALPTLMRKVLALVERSSPPGQPA